MGGCALGLHLAASVGDMRPIILLAALGTMAAPTPALAQYFGQNRVQYRHLDFAVIETEHFDVYYYDAVREAAVDGARMAERAYARLSRLLNHHYRDRRPIILFASHTDFQQNNVTPIGEGTGGVTEFLRHRVLLPFTGSYAEFEHMLQHEIVHQFQIDVFARGHVGGGIQQLIAVNPPLWFMEGMAEYLALGPVTPQTAMWLRDAALEGGLPTLHALTHDPRYSPYRFGHALWSYIGERWGDGAVAELLHGAAASGVDAAFHRVLGMSLETLVREWQVAVQRTYLPQLTDHQRAREVGRPVLVGERTPGTLHIAPAISPDGREIAYFSEGGSYFIDLYLADAETGSVQRRLIKSAFSSDFESLRFLNSAGAWSPDGRLFAIAVKHGGRDDLVIYDMLHHRVRTRIPVPLHGVTTPSWSPDGRRLAFTGYEGGFSDLFIINADGTGLQRLTHDRAADLHPAWSPDGTRIAFVTDRGESTDFATLTVGSLAVAIYRLDNHAIERVPEMVGENLNPQWAPDGRSIAFVSDRTGIPNLFLYDEDERATYQLTNLFTGLSGITPLSPAISWAPQADRLAFTVYERREFNVYAIDHPRALKKTPWTPDTHVPVVAPLMAPSASPSTADGTAAPGNGGPDEHPHVAHGAVPELPPGGGSAPPADSTPALVSVRALLDSAALHLPDTSAFIFRDYSASLSPDYIVQPSIGYVRDNFGSGIFGGTAISLSDMLGNRRVLALAQLNGRLEEAQVLGVYANLSRRVNWATGVGQTPYFYFTGAGIATDSAGVETYTVTLERFIAREGFFSAHRPFDRFRRLELGVRAANVSRASLDLMQVFDPVSKTTRFDRDARSLGTVNYVQPSVAFVFDNSIPFWVGPLMGRRSRFEYAPAIGGWRFHQVLADYRRYDHLVGRFTFATRVVFFGRFGRDEERFPIFLGNPDLVRGYTAGSIRKHECARDPSRTSVSCGALEQLIGSRVAVFNAELRFPLVRSVALGFAPLRFPPIEGAIFFDAGMAWTSEAALRLRRHPQDDPARVRQPLTSVGFSLRTNLLGIVILRADYAKPLSREDTGAYWTLSLGPTF